MLSKSVQQTPAPDTRLNLLKLLYEHKEHICMRLCDTHQCFLVFVRDLGRVSMARKGEPQKGVRYAQMVTV